MQEVQNEIVREKPTEIQEKVSWYKFNSKISIASVFAALLMLFVVGVSFTLDTINKNDNQKEEAGSEKNNFIANGTIVYGYWTSNSSIINAYDLSNGKEATLATLGNNVKFIKGFNNHEFFYIDNTDYQDYGKELVIRNIESGIDKTIISADNGFGIDNYTVSPNGQYVAVWMVSNSTQSEYFAGSTSRVYTVNASNSDKYLIYDENSGKGQTVHYPVAITNTGEVFTDMFLPNSGAGWAHGMSYSDFTGATKRNIDSMKNGTYGSQPTVSPDGKYISFTGYDGTDGTDVVDGFRKALVRANTVELLDLSTQTRTRVDKKLNNAIYISADWDYITGELIFKSIEKEGDIGTVFNYSYNTINNKLSKFSSSSPLNILSILDGNKYLAVNYTKDASSLGNLGTKYNPGIDNLYIEDAAEIDERRVVPIKNTPLQLIAIRNSNYFGENIFGKKPANTSTNQIQLKALAIKPKLASKRTEQQNDPVPTDILKSPEISDVPPPPISEAPPPDMPRCIDISEALCGFATPIAQDMVQAGCPAPGGCYDSPLYMYGPSNTNVKVFIDTHTNNANVPMTYNTFNATLLDGKIGVGLNLVDSISFDYESRVKKLSPPKFGYIFNRDNISEGIKKIAYEFGLNFNETNDLLNFANKITSPFVFVSFYDQEISHNILPIYFDPKPDNYRNIVFYFKSLDNLPSILPDKPEIEPVKRGGFTAVEISYIISD